jgi:hypothetical protein
MGGGSGRRGRALLCMFTTSLRLCLCALSSASAYGTMKLVGLLLYVAMSIDFTEKEGM